MDPARVHPAALDVDRLLADCDVTRTRRSGPGGQNRNKVETAVVLAHRPSGLVVEASERRSQAENARVALFRLRLALAIAVRRPIGPDAGPSALWRSRCRGGRIAINPRHADFPALLAEALDVLAAREMDVRAAAGVLGCSASQLIRLLKEEPRALRRVNERRTQRGLRPLR
jgi:RF-1 domain